MKSLILFFFGLGIFVSSCSETKTNKEPKTYNSENANLVGGPMLGYTEHRETLIWLEVNLPENVPLIVKYISEESGEVASEKLVWDHPMEAPVKFVLKNLNPGTNYQYSIWAGEQRLAAEEYYFKTKPLWEWRQEPPDFSFLAGSCAYINEADYDRPGEPYGQDYRIFEDMSKQDADFMLWLGDNIYLREVDYSSESGIRYRYRVTRQLPQLKALLSKMPQYAIWDDHDYGPNNADISYELKEASLQAFKDYWGNKTYGEKDNPGIYSRFQWADAEFFLLDNRYHRSPNRMEHEHEEKRYLGTKQLQWLKHCLLNSRARFKFIAVGNQLLSPVNDFENYRHFKREWNELMDFIVQNEVKGVVFLSGDRHFAEINQYKRPGFYTIYDLTTSPLSSRPYKTFLEGKEGNNPARIPDKVATEQNYFKISVTGKGNNRLITVACFTLGNRMLWDYTIQWDDITIPR